jgi:hypothetical protein
MTRTASNTRKRPRQDSIEGTGSGPVASRAKRRSGAADKAQAQAEVGPARGKGKTGKKQSSSAQERARWIELWKNILQKYDDIPADEILDVLADIRAQPELSPPNVYTLTYHHRSSYRQPPPTVKIIGVYTTLAAANEAALVHLANNEYLLEVLNGGG